MNENEQMHISLYKENTNLKVIEIANAVGYENQGKFARVFAKKYGVAPLEYRRIKRGNL